MALGAQNTLPDTALYDAAVAYVRQGYSVVPPAAIRSKSGQGNTHLVAQCPA